MKGNEMRCAACHQPFVPTGVIPPDARCSQCEREDRDVHHEWYDAWVRSLEIQRSIREKELAKLDAARAQEQVMS